MIKIRLNTIDTTNGFKYMVNRHFKNKIYTSFTNSKFEIIKRIILYKF